MIASLIGVVVLFTMWVAVYLYATSGDEYDE